MRQVLFYIPLKVSWLPEGPALAILLLAAGLGLAAAAWLAALYLRRLPLPLREGLRNLSFMPGVAGVVAAALVYFLQDRLTHGIPIYGFGMMLFLAFLVCTWLAGRRAEREGIAREHIQDLAIWVFIGGLIGARVTFLLHQKPNLSWAELFDQIYRIWDGGIVLYGSVIGALVGYVGAYLFIFRKHHLSTLKLADVVAPSVAVGLCLGRLGCFLNGCCYGQVACAACPAYAVHFPLSAPAREGLVADGYQTAAGFTLAREKDQPRDGARVGRVDPHSPAYAAGLRDGDVIVAVNGRDVANADDLVRDLAYEWPRGQSDLGLKVIHRGETQPVALEPFAPLTLGLHPTQLYEVVSMFLLFLLLTAYYPFRRHDGEVMAILMLGYAAHRFLNELLRNDPRPVGFERYSSVILFAAGLLLWLYLWSRPAQYRTEVKAEAKGQPQPV
jgi:phosphatidylglycerol:prolipoprotein diacylglycerol transferase